MKKRYIGIILLLALAGSALVGCAGNKNESQNKDTQSNVQQDIQPEVSSNVESEKNKEQQNVEPEKNKEQKNNEAQDNKKSNKNCEKNKSEVKEKGNKKVEDEKNDNKSTEYKKLSGKFVCIDSSIFDKMPSDKKDQLKKELHNAILKFNDDGTVFSGMVLKDGKEKGVSAKFTQTKDKLFISNDGNKNKEESNYTFDGKILKITDSKTNITLTFEKQ